MPTVNSDTTITISIVIAHTDRRVQQTFTIISQHITFSSGYKQPDRTQTETDTHTHSL